jgi:SAM-dependent methyltransferase
MMRYSSVHNMGLLNLFLEPKLKGIDLQGFDRIALHAEILAQKPLIREVFKEFYDTSISLDRIYFDDVAGYRVEVGAGTSLFKKYYSDVISTDVQPAPHLDAVIDAQEMNLRDESVRAIFGINSFHHFPDPCKFFHELLRVLKPGGGCVLIDPYFGLLSRILYKHLFSSEAYECNARDWDYCADHAKKSMRPNQALTYLVFFRDRARFDTLFPQLEIVHSRVLPNYIRYLASGGLNFRQVVPSFLTPLLRRLEVALLRLAPIFALHHVVVIRKRKSRVRNLWLSEREVRSPASHDFSKMQNQSSRHQTSWHSRSSQPTVSTILPYKSAQKKT